MEDNTKQLITADASLYNGQPTDTGSSCPSARLTSCTPSISKNKGGVSVENVPYENKQWYVLRVSYGRIVKAKAFIKARGMECYVPLRYKEIRKHGKRRIITEPLLPSLVFVWDTRDRVDALLHDEKRNPTENKSLLNYYYAHTIQLQDSSDRNPPLTISNEAMNNFVRLTSIENPYIIPVTSPNIQYKQGDHVVVTDGDFKGIHRIVARIAGQQIVVVQLFDGCLVATAYVPKGAMEKDRILINMQNYKYGKK